MLHYCRDLMLIFITDKTPRSILRWQVFVSGDHQCILEAVQQHA